MITNNTSINDLPLEILKHTISFLDLKSLMEVAPTNKTIEKFAREFYWDKIFNHPVPSNLTSGLYDTNLTKAAKRIEPLFDSPDENDQIKLNDFMLRCNSMEVTDFLNKFYYAISDNWERSENYCEKLIINLFNHSATSKVFKLKILEMVEEQFMPQLKWDVTIDDGLVPNHYKSLSYQQIPVNYTSKFHISDKNSFKKDELVALLVDDIALKPTLLFGKILGKTATKWGVKQWRVSFDITQYNQFGEGVAFKTNYQIGKFPSDCELPSFCSM